MRDIKSYVPPVPLNGVMRAGGVGRVVASKNKGFAVGDLVCMRWPACVIECAGEWADGLARVLRFEWQGVAKNTVELAVFTDRLAWRAGVCVCSCVYV